MKETITSILLLISLIMTLISCGDRSNCSHDHHYDTDRKQKLSNIIDGKEVVDNSVDSHVKPKVDYKNVNKHVSHIQTNFSKYTGKDEWKNTIKIKQKVEKSSLRGNSYDVNTYVMHKYNKKGYYETETSFWKRCPKERIEETKENHIKRANKVVEELKNL